MLLTDPPILRDTVAALHHAAHEISRAPDYVVSRPESGQPDAYPNLQPVLSKPINWDLIRQQYDEMVKYTTALKLGTADAETILRLFTRNNIRPTRLCWNWAIPAKRSSCVAICAPKHYVVRSRRA